MHLSHSSLRYGDRLCDMFVKLRAGPLASASSPSKEREAGWAATRSKDGKCWG